MSEGDPDKKWTVEELAKFGGIGGMGPVIVGSAQAVADVLQEWVADTDVDGFNLAYAVTAAVAGIPVGRRKLLAYWLSGDRALFHDAIFAKATAYAKEKSLPARDVATN